MKAKLIAYTIFSSEMMEEISNYELENNIVEQYSSQIERVICYIARVSNPNNQLNHKIENLIKYCIDNKHWSIFEQGDLTIEVETSVAIVTQMLRHKFKVQQFSQRYQDVTKIDEYPFEEITLRRQDNKNRQNSIDDIDQETLEYFDNKVKELEYQSLSLYKEMLSRGIAKESARFMLLQKTKSRGYFKNDIRGWIHYLQVRTEPSTQKEHRDIALACKKIFIKELPIISQALGWV